jgi:uncharacterized protein YcbX
MRIAALHRYPLKGFSPERLTRVVLEAGGHFPADRLFAIENGPSGFDPAAPTHQPKIKYLMLMKNEAIARLVTRYDDESGVLSITHEGTCVAEGDLSTLDGRSQIEAFLEDYLPAEEQRGALRVLGGAQVGAYRFTDSPRGFVSLLNLASVADLENRIDAPLDPLRFRANIHLEGLPAWAEFGLLGQSFEAASGLRLTITRRIDRCAATAVEPVTGLRDLPVVRTLMQAYGHIDCGVYAEITRGGTLAEGHRLLPAEPAAASPLGL